MRQFFSAAGRFALCALLGALCAALLIFSDAVRSGVLEGLHTSAQVVIPSLFPFMAVSGIIAQSRAGELLSRPLSPLTRRLLKLPPCMGMALLLSALGGYPVGAKTIAILLEQGRISRADAQRALCFCCNAGPSFVITAVGARMLGSARAGAALLFIHLAASLAVGAAVSWRLPVPPRAAGKSAEGQAGLPFGEALVAGVNGAAYGIFIICAYVVIFSALGALLRGSGLCALLSGAVSRLIPLPGGEATVAVLLLGPLEVTSGCMAAAALPGRLPLLLIPFFISFAGFSIFFQIRAALQPYHLRYGRFLACRALHGLLTALPAFPVLMRLVRYPVAAFGNSAVPVAYHTPETPLGILLLLSVCTLALWSLTPEAAGKGAGKPEKTKPSRKSR